MDPAVVMVCIKSRAYIIMHMATVIQAWHSLHDPDIRHWSTYIGNFNPVENTAAQMAHGKHKSITEHFLPAGNIQMQRRGSSWKPRQSLFTSEDRAQRIPGSQWARPERLSAWRSEDNPLLPVTSSDCCLQLTTQCWKPCSSNSHIPVQICRCLFCLCSIGTGAAPISLSAALGAPTHEDPGCFTAAVLNSNYLNYSIRNN